LGTIVGDADATPNVLGKRVHEKMSNFVQLLPGFMMRIELKRAISESVNLKGLT
jgi:hypothetical protein